MAWYRDAVCAEINARGLLSGCACGDSMVARLRFAEFADGEIEAEIIDSIRGRDVFLFASTSRNPRGVSVERCVYEVLHAVDAIRRARPRRIVLVEPFVGSARSDRPTRRNSIGVWIHYKTLCSLGVDHFLTFQLHSDKTRTIIDPMVAGLDDIPASPILMRHVCDRHVRSLEGLEAARRDWVFCSVDAGGEKLAKGFAQSFGVSLAVAHKQRDYERPNRVVSTAILSAEPLEGKDLWIVDDMIDTGSSIFELIGELEKRGPRSIRVVIAHPVFSGKSRDTLAELLGAGRIASLAVMDTIDCSCFSGNPGIDVVPSAPTCAEAIIALHEDASLSRFFAPFDAEAYLRSRPSPSSSVMGGAR